MTKKPTGATAMIDVIATFNHKDQEWFKCAIWTDALKSERRLINYIKTQFEHPNDLIKLSLCWECDKKIVDQYRVIRDSIKKSAKYYFKNGKLLK
jgi:hypothetical protein